MRDFHRPGRSPVYAVNGMASTSHPLASGIAVDILKRGGNAVDAAVAAAAALAVCEPHMTGIGGDCFVLMARNDGALIGLNGSGRAPAAARTEDLLARGIAKIEGTSGLSVTVPGAVDAWHRMLAAHGTMGLDTLLAPAIDMARRGVPIAPRVAWDWAEETAALTHEGVRRHYLRNDGTPPAAGDVMAFPALAGVLERIAAEGPDAFYRGTIAEEIARTVQEAGGLLDADDLAAVEGDFVEPITSPHGDHTIAELPPSTQGITALLMLGILDRAGRQAKEPESGLRYHLEMEAARLAYALRARHLSDPAYAQMTSAELLAPAHLDALAARIDPAGRADIAAAGLPADTDTVYLTVVDGERNAVSFINSLFGDFGAKIATPRTGILLQNRGACFVVSEGHPNTIGPRKRPLHTLIPGMILKDGRWTTSFGVMGGQYQAAGHAHFVTNLLDYGMDVQEALDSPRVFFDGDTVIVEDTVSGEAIADLKARGNRVAGRKDPLGGGQAVVFDRERDVLIGGSDPRKDGCSLGY